MLACVPALLLAYTPTPATFIRSSQYAQQTAFMMSLDEKIEGVVEPTTTTTPLSEDWVNPALCAPGEEFKKALYTKDAALLGEDADADTIAALLADFKPADVEQGWELVTGEAQSVRASSKESLDPLLQTCVEATMACVADPDPNAQEAYGDWCRDNEREALLAAMRGLRGRKLAWWLDAPRPLRAVIARGPKYEVSVVALPNGQALPPAAWPRGSVMLCQPLLGHFTVRRLRYDITGKDEKPIELMKRALRFGDKPLMLSGGSCHEFVGVPGAAAAFLQVAMLPPASKLPRKGGESGGRIGWRRPPGESCDTNDDVVSGVTIGAEVTVNDLVLIDRPTQEALAAERELSRAANPSDKQSLADRIGDKVGGLDAVVNAVVRRALAARLYPPSLTRSLGIQPARGLLLYGPPGCGKTLLAREIAAAMGAREPKIVNGPEMMSKYVGDSEEYIRGLFAEAEIEQAEAGDESALHVIVFDEIDAFTRERGSLAGDTSGIRDSVVNQLLAKMDGVEQLENILIIGMTNRPELIDAALLRPGRMEVQVEVARPNAAGRQQIAAIHSRRLRERGTLDAKAIACLASGALADATEGFSGADIAGLFRSAISFALQRYVEEGMMASGEEDRPTGGRQQSSSSGVLEVTFHDLAQAIGEVRPTGDSATRAELASNGRGLVTRASTGWRGWRRRRRLVKATDRAMEGMMSSS